MVKKNKDKKHKGTPFLMYHGLREGKLHLVEPSNATFFPPGEIDERIYDKHPTEEEIVALANETKRQELNPHRVVEG